MIKAALDPQGHNGHIELQPNLSHSWKTNKRIFYVFCLISLLIGLRFSMLGLWLILPFSVLELLFLAITLYYFFYKNTHREVIRLTDDKVLIETGRTSVHQTWEYSRYWSQFYVDNEDEDSLPSIRIRSKGRETELGSFLGNREKKELIQLLKSVTRNFQLHQQVKPGHLI